MTPPERVFALVVGIERYEAGDEWDLNGCVASALRIVRWLRKCQVPPGNITALLSPLEENLPAAKQDLAELGLPSEPEPATVDVLRRVVTEQLPSKDGDLLVVYWSGHGVLDRYKQRRLFCANAAVNAKYNINVTELLAALSGKNFSGLRDQVLIVDACANFIQQMKLKLREPESGFAIGDTRPVWQEALLAAAQGEKASLDQKARSGTFGRMVADWLEEQPPALPPAMDELAAHVVAGFERLRDEGVTGQHPVRIREILHGIDNEHEFGGEPVAQNVWLAARSARLTTEQVRRTAAVVAAVPQLATPGNRAALATAIQGAVGALPGSTDDPEADLLDMVSAVLDQRQPEVLFRALRDLAVNEEERIAAAGVRHRWELQAAVKPLLGLLRQAPWAYIRSALADTVPDAPNGISGVDQALELLADLRGGLATPPLAEFLVRLQLRWPDLAGQIGSEWFADQGLDEPALAALRARVSAEAQMRRKLVIDLRPSTPEHWQPTVTGYLGPKWWSQTVTCQSGVGDVSGADVRGAVVRLVEWAKSRASDLAIGFLLGYGLLRELPEQWEYEDLVIAPVRLCEEHPVVLHAAERIAIPQLRPAWDSKLAAIGASAGDSPGVLWLDRDDARAIRQAVQASNDAYVAFSFVPEARPDLRASAVMAAIAAGAPSVVWVQAAPEDGYDLRARLGQILGPIKNFPAALRQGRAADPYLSDTLRVIWDHLDELPPYLGRLGEELISNG